MYTVVWAVLAVAIVSYPVTHSRYANASRLSIIGLHSSFLNSLQVLHSCVASFDFHERIRCEHRLYLLSCIGLYMLGGSNRNRIIVIVYVTRNFLFFLKYQYPTLVSSILEISLSAIHPSMNNIGYNCSCSIVYSNPCIITYLLSCQSYKNGSFVCSSSHYKCQI